MLDFGLAKARSARRLRAAIVTSLADARPPRATQAGVILGHRRLHVARAGARQAGRQARPTSGRSACVLYEMLTGKRCFDGETVSDVLASVLRQDPDWTALPADTPPGVRLLLRRCLERDRKKRLRDIGDAWFEGPAVAPAASVSEVRREISDRLGRGRARRAGGGLRGGALDPPGARGGARDRNTLRGPAASRHAAFRLGIPRARPLSRRPVAGLRGREGRRAAEALGAPARSRRESRRPRQRRRRGTVLLSRRAVGRLCRERLAGGVRREGGAEGRAPKVLALHGPDADGCCHPRLPRRKLGRGRLDARGGVDDPGSVANSRRRRRARRVGGRR